MQTLNIYEVGVDPLPDEHTQIIVFDEVSSYGIFAGVSSSEGSVSYEYHESFDTLNEALKECIIETTKSICHDYEEDINSIGVFIEDVQLIDGMKWLYVHEAYPIISNILMPVQEWEYWKWCVKQGIININSYDEDVFAEHTWYNYTISFNGSSFKVVWRSCQADGMYFSTFEVI